EEIDVVSVTDDVLPPSVDNDDSDEEVDVLRVDNFIQNSEHEYFESEIPPLITRHFHYHLQNHQIKDLILRLKFQLRGVQLSSLNVLMQE
nr:hypothetical protein [Tanacetum cinerariifolium]